MKNSSSIDSAPLRPIDWDVHEGVEIIVDDVVTSKREDLTIGVSLVAVLLVGKLAMLQFTIWSDLFEATVPSKRYREISLKSLTVPMLQRSNAAIGVDS